jgi:hypothetical protein
MPLLTIRTHWFTIIGVYIPTEEQIQGGKGNFYSEYKI